MLSHPCLLIHHPYVSTDLVDRSAPPCVNYINCNFTDFFLFSAVEKEKKKEKVETAILSITAKHKKKELEKKKSVASDTTAVEKMDV